MHSYYYSAKGMAIAMNAKAGSSSLAAAILRHHYPETYERLRAGTYLPAGRSFESVRLHSRCPKTEPDGLVVILPVRDPVDRFCSACAETGIIDIDLALEHAAGNRPDSHFWPQSRFLVSKAKEIRLYKFPEHLAELESALEVELPNIRTLRERPVPTDTQRERILGLYSSDAALFESIVNPGQLYPVA